MRPHAFAKPVRIVFGACLLLALAGPAHGLIKFNDGHDEIFVTGTAGIGYDSNLFATADAVGDTTTTASVDLDYQRKAGMLGVNANLGWKFGKFAENTSEDYVDPHARAELTKSGGRTTGSLTLGVERQSRAEYALSLRTTSMNYDAGLNVKYPVIERYSIAGQLGYDYQDYIAKSSGLYDIRDYTASADLYYVYTSERDLLGGYRLRVTDTTNDTRSYDHAFTVGTTGKLLPKLNGTVRFGYQFRQTDRNNYGVVEKYSDFTGSASATWTVSRRFNVTGIASSDFSTLATDVNVQTTAVMLDATFAATGKFSFFGGLGGGHLNYLGAASNGRQDSYFTSNAGVRYTMNDHLIVTLSSMYYKNWSEYDQANYVRRTISLIVSSRW
jgi:hypothetical protein